MLLNVNMMRNSEPNHFIWVHIFKKAPTSEGGTSPLRHPPGRASATAGADAPFFTSKNLPPPFEIVPPPMLNTDFPSKFGFFYRKIT